MKNDDMFSASSETMIQRLEALDLDQELRALREHIAVTSPVALELLAYEHLSSPRHEIYRVAAIQLRVVVELASGLRWLEHACFDPELDPALRVALTSILWGLCNESDALLALASEAGVLLEPALLFHELITHLRPWLPPTSIALEPKPVLELLRLAIPDYLHPLLRARFEALWADFHRLRQSSAERAPAARSPARLAVITDPPIVDHERSTIPAPPPPTWTTPSWASPWLGDSNSPLRELPALANIELTG